MFGGLEVDVNFILRFEFLANVILEFGGLEEFSEFCGRLEHDFVAFRNHALRQVRDLLHRRETRHTRKASSAWGT